jgi:hypothetical protein
MPLGNGKKAQVARENLLGYINRKQGHPDIGIVTTAQAAAQAQLAFASAQISDGPPIVIQDPVTGVIPATPGFDIPVVAGTIS